MLSEVIIPTLVHQTILLAGLILLVLTFAAGTVLAVLLMFEEGTLCQRIKRLLHR